MRWSERPTVVRSGFEMTSTFPLRPTRGFVRRRSSCSRSGVKIESSLLRPSRRLMKT